MVGGMVGRRRGLAIPRWAASMTAICVERGTFSVEELEQEAGGGGHGVEKPLYSVGQWVRHFTKTYLFFIIFLF